MSPAKTKCPSATHSDGCSSCCLLMGIVLGGKTEESFSLNCISWSTCAFWVKREPLLCQTNRCLDLSLASSSSALYLNIMVLMAWPAQGAQGKWEYSSGCLQNGSNYDGTTLLKPSPSFCFQSLPSHLHVSFRSLLHKCFLTPHKLKWGSCP